MDGLFSERPAAETMTNDLGRSSFIRQPPGVELLDVDREPSEVRPLLRRQCPLSPGVYGMVDRQGELIYVGMSGRLRDRLLTYFTKGPPQAKEQRIAARTDRLMWEVSDHELIVRLRELELIRRWRPRFNSIGQPGRREIGYISLNSTDAPNFRFGQRPLRASRRCWGPLPLTRLTRGAVKQLNYLFQLRDCPDRVPVHFVDQLTILADAAQPACLRGAVGTCLAPCAGDRSRAEYMQGVARACAFLDGRDRSLIEHYESAMGQAAAAQQYEQAAKYRDTFQSLDALWRQLDMVRNARGEYAGVHVLRGCSGRTWWALVGSGKVAAILREPRSPRSARQCLKLLQTTFARSSDAEPEDFEQMKILVSWYRRFPEQLDSAIDPAKAVAVCEQRTERSSAYDS